MSFQVVIPARYASVRLPGKPLLLLGGKPMIQWVWQQACDSGAKRVLVATDDVRIQEVATGFGAEVAMTDASLASGTDRVYRALQHTGVTDEVIVNLQGDEPLMPPAVIAQVATLLEETTTDMATLGQALDNEAQWRDSNTVKVIVAAGNRALYFSRAAIPQARDWHDLNADVVLRHIGIYAYRMDFLAHFVQYGVCALEQTERLEQLRALYLGASIAIDTAVTPVPQGVDCTEDLERIAAMPQLGA